MRCLLSVILSIIPALSVFTQPADSVFFRPLDLPVALSGKFAELRTDHFHSGIDYRTQGTIGHKIYAAEKGYVSRISVSPTGYGKALYIDHPNGYTTVYGHLEDFSDDIAAYVRQEQYRTEKFQVNLFPDSTLFPVKRGEVVAFSGNTGSSGGPHLHFEVRETVTEMPLNPMSFGFGIKDNIAPTIHKLAVYPIGEGSTVNGSAEKLILDLEKSGKGYRIAGNKKIKITGKAAFGINAFDQSNGSTNRCGIYNIRFWVDSAEIFSQTMDKFSFDDTRYINSLIDYAWFREKKVRFNRLYIEPNNQLNVYDLHINRGIISLPDSAEYKALIMTRDFHGNIARLDFSFISVPGESSAASAPSSFTDLMTWPVVSGKSYKKEFVFKRNPVKVTIPADALYDEIDFEYRLSPPLKDLYSGVHHIHNIYTPLHKAMTVEISADSLPEHLRERALLVRIEPRGERVSAGGAYQDGVVSASSRVFGNFAIGVDTIPPRITPINIKNGANMRGVKNMRFRISDNFSGIHTYNGWIDDQWVLFEYDAKNHVIFYDFDPKRLTGNKKHHLKLIVSDHKGNMAEYNAGFTW